VAHNPDVTCANENLSVGEVDDARQLGNIIRGLGQCWIRGGEWGNIRYMNAVTVNARQNGGGVSWPCEWIADRVKSVVDECGALGGQSFLPVFASN
jgi:hypothetical protein